MGGKLRLECKIKKKVFEKHLELDCSSQARKDMHTEDEYCTLRVENWRKLHQDQHERSQLAEKH